MTTDTTMHPIEKWFNGKGLKVIREFVLPKLAEAEKLGYWPKGVSRTVKSALTKANIAKKFAKTNETFLENLSTGDTRHNGARGWDIQHVMYFGLFEGAPKLIGEIKKLRKGAKLWTETWTKDHFRDYEASKPDAVLLTNLLDTADQWAADFAPIADLVEKLDATRAVPTFIMKTLSPTVVANVGKNLGVDFTTIRLPEFEWTWKDVEINGKKVRIPVTKIIWPEGTLHNQSRFSFGSQAGNQQCQACGHAIRNHYNWAPLVADRDGKPPVSLWVGKDCAKNLFGVEIQGEADFKYGKEG